MISKRLSRVLLAPLVSEKSANLENGVAFWVDKDASKADVKDAVERMFEVKVHSVRTATSRKRAKARQRRPMTVRKKAYIRLVEGYELDLATE